MLLPVDSLRCRGHYAVQGSASNVTNEWQSVPLVRASHLHDHCHAVMAPNKWRLHMFGAVQTACLYSVPAAGGPLQEALTAATAALGMLTESMHLSTQGCVECAGPAAPCAHSQVCWVDGCCPHVEQHLPPLQCWRDGLSAERQHLTRRPRLAAPHLQQRQQAAALSGSSWQYSCILSAAAAVVSSDALHS
jgi:hypothetical protein